MTTPPMTPEEIVNFPHTDPDLKVKDSRICQSAVAHAKELIALRALARRMAERLGFVEDYAVTERLIRDCRKAGLLPPEPSAEDGEGEKT